jgi:hypothetical protein
MIKLLKAEWMRALQGYRSFKKNRPEELGNLLIVVGIGLGIVLAVLIWNYRIDHGLYGKLIMDATWHSGHEELQMRFFSEGKCVVDYESEENSETSSEAASERQILRFYVRGDTVSFDAPLINGVGNKLLRQGDKLYFLSHDRGNGHAASYLRIRP